jgi:hypothetical protein
LVDETNSPGDATMYKVKESNFTNNNPEHRFATWAEVQEWMKTRNKSYPIIITHPNGKLVFPDSPDGAPVKERKV